MAVKVLIKRHIKEGQTKEVIGMLTELRSLAMDQTGYISGETLLSHFDPHRIVVIGMWHAIEHWLAWKENAERKEYEAKIEQHLEFPTEYEEYLLGIFPHHPH